MVLKNVNIKSGIAHQGAIYIDWYDDKAKFHRVDGPAIEYSNGDSIWYNHGVRQIGK